MWQRVREAGLVEELAILSKHLYDPVGGTFLADRFVLGLSELRQSDQYTGDSCDRGATYAATDDLARVVQQRGPRQNCVQASSCLCALKTCMVF